MDYIKRYPRDWTRTERQEADENEGRLAALSDDGYPRVSEEIRDELCSAVLWRDIDGARFACPFRATYKVGELRFCPEHNRTVEQSIHQLIHKAARKGPKHWIYRALVGAHRDAYDKAVRRQARKRERYRLERVEAARKAAPSYSAPGYVYFVRIGAGDGPIKIGTTRDVEQRLAAIAWGSPYPVTLLAVTPGNHVLEHAYHDRFLRHRMSGEWFKPAPAILAEIERINADVEHLSVAVPDDGALF